MNITKTNPYGVMIMNDSRIFSESFVKDMYAGAINEQKKDRILNGYTREELSNNNTVEFIGTGHLHLHISKYSKVLKLSKSISHAVNKIDYEYIVNHIDVLDLDFNHLFILLENDKEGIINIRRKGSDVEYCVIPNIDQMSKDNHHVHFNTYSFISKDFLLPYENDDRNINIFVIKLLAYLYYGDITTKYLTPNSSTKVNSFFKFTNNSKLPITYVNTLWKQRINTSGFKVKGHFRMQTCGEKHSKRKLIWIEEFAKNGYNRKATKEMA